MQDLVGLVAGTGVPLGHIGEVDLAAGLLRQGGSLREAAMPSSYMSSPFAF